MSRAVSVPTLADIITEPDKAKGLPRHLLGALLIELAAAQTRLGAELVSAPEGVPPAPPDHLLTIDEVAARLRIGTDTAQKWLRRKPYNQAVVVRSRTCVRVSAQLLEQVLQGGSGRRASRSERVPRVTVATHDRPPSLSRERI